MIAAIMKQRFKNAAPGAPGTQAVVRAVAILQALGGPRREWGLSELAAEVALHKTTVFRLLGALEGAGFVARDDEHQRYRLGGGLVALAAQALRASDLRTAAHPVLKALAAETGESATLEVLAGDEVLILDEMQGRFLVGMAP